MSDDLTRLTDEEVRRIELEGLADTDVHTAPLELIAAVESIIAARTAALIDRAERAERERDEVRVYNCGDCGHRIDNHGDEGRCSIRFARVGVWAQCPCISPTAVRIAQLESGWRKTNAECIAHWNRADEAEAELAALRAAVTGLADKWHDNALKWPYAVWADQNVEHANRLRALLTDEGNNQ